MVTNPQQAMPKQTINVDGDVYVPGPIKRHATVAVDITYANNSTQHEEKNMTFFPGQQRIIMPVTLKDVRGDATVKLSVTSPTYQNEKTQAISIADVQGISGNILTLGDEGIQINLFDY